MTSYHQSEISRLLHESLIKLCTESVPFRDHLEVDGIICLSSSDIGHQIVVKVHEVLNSSDTNIVTVEPTTSHESTEKENEQQSFLLKKLIQEDLYKSSGPNCAIPETVDMLSEKENFIGQMGHFRLSKGELNDLSKPCRKRKRSKPQSSAIVIEDDEGLDEDEDSEELSNHSNSINIPTPTTLTIPEIASLPMTMPMPSKHIVPTARRKPIKSPHALDHLSLSCRFCSSPHPGFNALYNHQLEWHKRYTCRYCFNTFSMKCNLRRHERQHVGNKYVCNICSKTFTRNHDLKFHEIKHHGSAAASKQPMTDVDEGDPPKKLRESNMAKLSPDIKDNVSLSGLRISFIEKPGVSWSSDTNHDLDINSLQPIIIKPDTPKVEVKNPFSAKTNVPCHEQDKDEPVNNNTGKMNRLIDLARSQSPFSVNKGESSTYNGTQSSLFNFDAFDQNIGSRRASSSPSLSPRKHGGTKSEQEEPLNLRKNKDVKNSPSSPSRSSKSNLANLAYHLNKDNYKKLNSGTSLLHKTMGHTAEQIKPKVEPTVKTESHPEPHASDSSLLKLEAIMPAGKRYRCNMCSLEYPNLEKLDEHCWGAHLRYSCPICVQTFSNRNNRARHVRSHTGEREYVCNECGKTFSRSDTLKEHQIIHTDGYIVQQCSFCGKKIDKKALLLNHIKKCAVSRKREVKGMLIPHDKVPSKSKEGTPTHLMSFKMEGSSENLSVFAEPSILVIHEDSNNSTEANSMETCEEGDQTSPLAIADNQDEGNRTPESSISDGSGERKQIPKPTSSESDKRHSSILDKPLDERDVQDIELDMPVLTPEINR